MKVTFCAYDGKNIINGINAWLLRLLPFLKSQGFDITILFITWADVHECTVLPIFQGLEIKSIIIPKPHYSERIVKWILDYINKEKPDVFIPNNMTPALHASEYIREVGIPTIAVLHNDDSEYKALIDEFVSNKNHFQVTAVVPVSNSLFRRLAPYEGTVMIRQIPCGAPVSKMESSYNLDDIFRIVYVGRIIKEQKNIDLVVKTFCEIVNKIPKVEAYIYGAGPDEDVVHNILKLYNFPQNVILRGNLPSADIQNELLNAHVFVLMSSYEGIPVAMMEAMACGVVPICKKIESGVPELLENNVTGFFIQDSDDLIEKILLLKDSPERWQQLSQNAKKLIEDKFSTNYNNNQWLNLLHEVRPEKNLGSFELPKYIKLPPVNQFLASHDEREPNFSLKFKRKVNRYIKKIIA